MCDLSLLEEESQEIGRWERDIDKEREGKRGEIKNYFSCLVEHIKNVALVAFF